MATVQCSKCTAERKGFRRELDSWRHKLIHCVGFESILEGIYGQMLLRDLKLFDDCEPEEVGDWSPAASYSQCSFCNLPLDKLSDQAPAATSPLSSISESSQSAHRFLQAVFHKKDVPLGCDSNIPLVAQELMKKMIHQFALEYASKCLLYTSTNGVTTRTSSPLSVTSDAPLDLTVSRTQEEKESESEPDGVLDLSNRNSACSETSSTFSASHKASGFQLPSRIGELGDVERQATKCHPSSALDAVLSSLCPSHCSLLYQILKLAHQENLLLFLNHRSVCQIESHCCHCGENPKDHVTPNAVPFSECKAHNSSPYYPLTDCDHQSRVSSVYHPGDCKSNCSIHHCPLTNCESKAPPGSSYCCLQRPRMESYTVLCPKRLRCISCHSLPVGHTSNIVCSFASSSKSSCLCTASSSLCPSSSICCNQHNLHCCPCHSNNASLAQVRNTKERVVRDRELPCPVLKREQSPSPPPLSPIPTDINKKTDEKPPSLLHHRQEGEAHLMVKDDLVNVSHQEVDMDTSTEEEQHCQTPRSHAEQNTTGTLLQDVVNRFSEKLETIRPMEKDPPLDPTTFYGPEEEPPESPSSSQNLQFHADAHLTEIITTVLHTGSASDYNLSELFNRHDSKEPKSPITRSRRRQEVIAAMATPANDALTRRHTLQIKRELAMFDQAYSKKKLPLSKRAKLKNENVTVISSDSNLVKKESKKEMAVVELEPVIQRVREGPINIIPTEKDREKVKEETVIGAGVPIIKSEMKEREIYNNEKDFALLGSHIRPYELQNKFDKQSLKGDGLQTQVMAVTSTSVKHCGRSSEVHNCAGSDGNDNSGQSSGSDGMPCKGKEFHSEDARRSRRNIVPPQRFSSFVTEPRKMYFVACFSENVLNKRIRKDKAVASGPHDALSQDSDATDTQFKSRSEAPLAPSTEHACKLSVESAQREHCGPSSYKASNILSTNQVLTQTLAAKKKTPTKHTLDNGADGIDRSGEPLGRLRSTQKRLQYLKTTSGTPKNTSNINIVIKSDNCVESPPDFQVQYTSPIKLMFVSPVKDKGGVRYSLKSAGSSGQTEEPFDPYEESSWSGTFQKQINMESATLKIKSDTAPACSQPPKTGSPPSRSASSPASRSASSPASRCASSPPSKSASPPSKSASPPSKSASPPSKSASPPSKSASSSPRPKSTFFPWSKASSSSPHKSTSSPRKSLSSPAKSLKSACSSPKVSPRKSGEGTPTKRATGTETQRSPGDLIMFLETAPPKRRPGRPKKQGPQLEQKVKRPIGRPRKQKDVESVMEANKINGKFNIPSDTEEKVNKNLKITVVYGRSRRNKRTVSEGFGHLQTEFCDALQKEGLKGNLGILMHNSKTSSGVIKTASTELPEELNVVSPVNEFAAHSSSNIKCQKQDECVPLRKPGRPAKVKISGISVTVTTVSPRRRKIQINKNTRQSPGTLIHTKVLLPEFHSAKEPLTISCQSTNKTCLTEEGIEATNESKGKLPYQPVAVRHSVRVRKPSIHFLHAVATSTFRSFSHSNALLRRSKQLLLNKASNERRQAEQESSVDNSGEKNQVCGQKRQNHSKDLSRMAGVSVDSIFAPEETLRWWAASAEEKTMNQELARRIRHISDTWVSDAVEKQDGEIALNSKQSAKSNRKSKHSSVIRALFDCPPNKPSSCSMQQLCSWFMQTTETQSLAIVKKASSRNPYELMHFPRSANEKNICHSPQAERLRKHIKKFAKTVPKSPLQHQQAQRSLRKRNEARLSTHDFKRQLFSSTIATGGLDQGAQWRRNRAFGKYHATLLRARARFLNQRERDKLQKRQRRKKRITVDTSCFNGQLVMGLQPKCKALRQSVKYQLFDSSATSSVDQSQETVDVPKEQNLCSKAWSPETLKECRVFLRKINSPDNESTEDELDSCTVTLDDGSPSAYLFTGRKRELVEVVKTVKTERKTSMNKTASSELAGSAPKSVQEQDETSMGRQKGKYKSPRVQSTEPPPAKMLRQSRMRGLTGPRWCDFVFEN